MFYDHISELPHLVDLKQSAAAKDPAPALEPKGLAAETSRMSPPTTLTSLLLMHVSQATDFSGYLAGTAVSWRDVTTEATEAGAGTIPGTSTWELRTGAFLDR